MTKSHTFIDAASSGNLNKLFELMVDPEKFDIDAQDDRHKRYDGKTALIAAAEAGHAKVVSLLLNCKADITKPDNLKRTAIYVAAEGNHLEVMRLLVQPRDMNEAEKIQMIIKTELAKAIISAKNIEIIKVLVTHGAKINKDELESAVLLQDSPFKSSVIPLLLNAGAEVTDDLIRLNRFVGPLSKDVIENTLKQHVTARQEALRSFFLENLWKKSTGTTNLVNLIDEYAHPSFKPL